MIGINEKIIWDYLIAKIGNAFGVAGLMGNLYAESALKPTNLQGTYEKKLGMTDDQYTAAVDNGSYDNFVRDSAGYGLAQWTYWSRKQNLLNFAREAGKSIGDLDMQLDFLWKELQSYSSVLNTLKTAKSVREASDVVLLKYEKPANQGETVQQKRAGYGQKYYDAYASDTVADAAQEAERSVIPLFTNIQFAAYCLEVFARAWVYWYGTCGYKCTTSLYNSKKNQYPSQYTAARESGYKADINNGCTCADCVGLIKSFFWKGGDVDGTNKYGSNNCPDKGANSMFAMCKVTGDIKTIPDIPGLVVWKTGHIGVYVGNGYTVEMKGFAYDCKKLKVTDGTWTKWGKLPSSMLSYVDDDTTVPVVTYSLGDRTLKKGSEGNDVTELQYNLVGLGYDLGTYGTNKDGVDGDYGSKTEAAVKKLQKSAGLSETGIFDTETYKALLEALKPHTDPAHDIGTDTPDDGGKPAYVLILQGDETLLRNVQATYGGTLAQVDSVTVG